MPTSIKSVLTAGVTVIGATSIAFATAVAPPPQAPPAAHIVVPLAAAHDLPPLTTDDIQLLSVMRSLLSDAPLPTIAPSPPLIALADAIDAIYVGVEPWVRYGFEVAADVVAWIPWVGIFAGQIMVVYNFVESLINSGVFNTTDWLRGEGSAVKNVADWVVDLGLAAVWLAIDEVGAWIPLPPVGWYPPRPPVADLPEGFLGEVVVDASHALASVSHAIWNIWEPIESGVDWGVGAASDLLDAVSWIPFVPLINFELVEGWELIADEIDAAVGFANDMIDAGDQFVADAITGDGLVAAIVNAFNNTVSSIVTRAGEAAQALVSWGEGQIDYFFGSFTPDEAVLSNRQSVTTTEPAAADLAPEGSAGSDEPADVANGLDATTAASPPARIDEADESDDVTVDFDDSTVPASAGDVTEPEESIGDVDPELEQLEVDDLGEGDGHESQDPDDDSDDTANSDIESVDQSSDQEAADTGEVAA